MSAALYSAKVARENADLVRTTWPCQGVTVYAHPTVDRWVRIRYGSQCDWLNEPVSTALARTKALRSQIRSARLSKKVEHASHAQ